jgi:hypothetical protein
MSDKVTGKSIRLEPRLMKLLFLLIENRGQVVKRELIINQVWNDYPGAEEGLNQAISGLRKFLEDDQKKIIETIPKNGYCFHGTIEEAQAKQPTKPFKIAYLLTGILIVIAFSFLLRYHQATKALISEQLFREEAHKISKIDSARQAERLKTVKTK